MIRVQVTPKKEVCRAVEELRCTHRALIAAACGIGPEVGDDGGAYYLLLAVAEKMERGLAQLETLTGCTP